MRGAPPSMIDTEGVVRCTDLWGKVAAGAGGELGEGLGAHVAAPEGLGGDHAVDGGEGLLHGAADGGSLLTHLTGETQRKDIEG